MLLGLVAAEATQAVGALLLLGLLAAPAGAAHRLDGQPLPRDGAGGADRAAVDLGRARAELLDRRPAAEQRGDPGGGGLLRSYHRCYRRATPRSRAVSSRDASADSWAERAEATLAAAGHKRGGARRALLELLDGQACALTAQEIEEALAAHGDKRRVSRASVYRILDELERLRLVQRVETGQAMVRYERVCEREEHHHHLVCDECGLVMPFSDAGLERAIEERSARACRWRCPSTRSCCTAPAATAARLRALDHARARSGGRVGRPHR